MTAAAAPARGKEGSDSISAPWQRAILAARLLSVDPGGLGGVWVHGGAGPVRDRWMQMMAALMPERRVRRIAPGISDEALFGGVDLTASLGATHLMRQSGLLEGPAALLSLPLGERTPVDLAAKIARALEKKAAIGSARGAKSGAANGTGAQSDGAKGHAVLAYDGSSSDEPGLPAVLAERLAFWISLEGLSYRSCPPPAFSQQERDQARARLAAIKTPPEVMATVIGLASDLGITGFHAPLLALSAARAAAALDGVDQVGEAHCELAATLVLGPRAQVLPGAREDESGEQEQPEEHSSFDETHSSEKPLDGDGDLERAPDDFLSGAKEMMLEAIQTALPLALLDRLKAQRSLSGAQNSGSGHLTKGAARGRPLPPRRGKPNAKARLDLLATLKAAAPWQPLRRGDEDTGRGAKGREKWVTPNDRSRLVFRGSDLRVRRYQQRGERLILFVVDASGSAAIARLAEAKGAVEHLLADAYARRDSVALIAFRGKGADLILAPTRSLVRAKRSLAGLPGGGATPLAAGLKLAYETALSVQGRGQVPALILMTDARANVTINGEMDRKSAQDDAEKLARLVVHAKIPAILIDTATRRSKAAEELAHQLRADYVALPRGDAKYLSQSIQAHLPSAA